MTDITSGVRQHYVRLESKVFANSGFAIMKSEDNGQSYSEITPPDFPGHIRSLYVGEVGSLSISNSVDMDAVYWSRDDGAVWELLNVFPSAFPFFDDEVASISEDSNGVIYVTTNWFDFDDGMTVV